MLHDLGFNGVALVPDVSDDLLKHILHRHNAQRTAVLVGNNGKMLLGLAQLREHCGELHGLIHIARGHQQLADVRAAVVSQRLEKMVEIKYADDIVDAALIDRKARIGRILDKSQNIVPVVLNVDSLHVDTRGHNVERGGLGKIYRGLNELGLILVEHIFVLGGLDDGLQLLHGLVGAVG